MKTDRRGFLAALVAAPFVPMLMKAAPLAPSLPPLPKYLTYLYSDGGGTRLLMNEAQLRRYLDVIKRGPIQ